MLKSTDFNNFYQWMADNNTIIVGYFKSDGEKLQ